MKFGRTLDFNLNPDWQEHYVNYKQLKKIIKQMALEHNSPDNVSTDCLVKPAEYSEFEGLFLQQLRHDLQQVHQFYQQQRQLCQQQLRDLKAMMDTQPMVVSGSPASLLRSPSSGLRGRRNSWPDAALPPNWSLLEAGLGAQLQATGSDESPFAEAAKGLYLFVHDLRDYLQLNYTAFQKILKKHDKHRPACPLRPRWQSQVEATLPLGDLPLWDALSAEIEAAYAVRVCGGSAHLAEARGLLRHLLRERLTFERTTVWQAMLEQERKAGLKAGDDEDELADLDGEEKGDISEEGLIEGLKEREGQQTGWRRFACLPRTKRAVSFVVCTALFILLLLVPTVEDPAQARCLALLVYASALWSTECMPLFVTAMLIPLLVVMLRVLKEKETGEVLAAPKASYVIMHAMFSQVIMLLLGGMALAAALSKHGLTRMLATQVLGRVGRQRPGLFLAACMVLVAVCAMGVSNVAAPVLVYSIIQPIFRHLGKEQPLSKALVMGVCLAANIGGISTPISSPQNLVAVEVLTLTSKGCPSWPQWLAVTLPCLLLGLAMAYAVTR